MVNMGFGRRGAKVAPSTYPKIPFHGLRALQLLSSLVVGSIMYYFIYHLSRDHWNIPWTFIFFTSASMITIVSLCTTIVLHCCFGLNPRFNLMLNGALFLLWGAGFGMLSWWASITLFHRCAVENWHDEVGVMVCRIYKALYAFGLLGFVSTLSAFVLDIIVFKRATRLGKYNMMRDGDIKPGVVPYNDVNGSHGMDLPAFNARAQQTSHDAGYAIPEQQFGYDTTYHGAHPMR